MTRTQRPSDSDPRSILVVLPTWVGDFVMATPTLRAIRDRFAAAHIVFLMEPNLRDLVRGGNWMDECVEWPAKAKRTLFHRAFRNLVRGLRSRRFDLAVLLPNSFRSALLARLIGAKRRIGYDRDARGFLLTDRIPVRNRRAHPSRGLQPARLSDPSKTVDAGNTLAGEPPYVFSVADTRSQYRDCKGAGLHKDDPAPGSVRLARFLTGAVLTGAVLRKRSDTLNTCEPPAAPGTASRELQFARTQVGVGGRTDNDLLHPPAPPGKYIPMPIVDYYADLAEYLGCDRPGDALELFTTPDCDASLGERLRTSGVKIDNAHPIVVLSPGAKYGAAKCWPADRFAAAADQLIEREHATVVVTCGPGEERIARAIASHMKHDPVVFSDPLLSLGELKSLIRRSDLLICNDAGPRHFAKAFGVPVVTVFGPTHPDWTATSYPHERIVRINVDCGPCQQRVCPLGHLKCMTGVSVEMVLDAARDLLCARTSLTDASSTTP